MKAKDTKDDSGNCTLTTDGWTFGGWTYTIVDKPDVTQRHTDNETVDETAPL